MSDAMRYTPAHVSVKKNVTVRFVLKNEGKLEHETSPACRRATTRPA